jgi:hypothetical protein
MLHHRRWGRMGRRRRTSPSSRNGRAGSVCNDFTWRGIAADLASLRLKSSVFEHLIPFHLRG